MRRIALVLTALAASAPITLTATGTAHAVDLYGFANESLLIADSGATLVLNTVYSIDAETTDGVTRWSETAVTAVPYDTLTGLTGIVANKTAESGGAAANTSGAASGTGRSPSRRA